MGDYTTLIDNYLDYLFTYGPFWVYLVILAACFVENLFPPFPGDTFIVAAGGLVAMNRLEFIPAIASAMTGGMLSIMLMFLLGRRYGREYFIRKNFKYFSAADIGRIEIKFTRYGALILLFSRFVVGVRSALAVVAGIGRYNTVRMFVYSLISYFLFAGLLMYISISLVENFDLLAHYLKTYKTIIWPAVILLVVWYLIRRFWRNQKNKK